MGKVGSVSLEATLAKYLPNKLVHAHNFGDMAAEDQERWSRAQRLNEPILLITPIREPLTRNISAFFQNFKRDTGQEVADRSWEVAEVEELFLQRYPHEVALEWFDVSFRPATGVDIYAEPFPRERKWQVYTRGSMRILVYRTDLGYPEQLRVVAEFLQQPIEGWVLGNRAEDKSYADLYWRFCTEARFPDHYIERLGDSKFCRHFWSRAEIEVNAARWRRPSAGGRLNRLLAGMRRLVPRS